jgi:fatty-acyl-CoA synthase
VRSEFGIDVVVELVPTRTLPRTSSGKLARARARLDYLGRRHAAKLLQQQDAANDTPVEEPFEQVRYIA